MTNLASFSASFSVEEEEAPDFDELLNEVEMRLRQLDGVYAVSADVASSTRRYVIVAEVEGEGFGFRETEEEIDVAIRECVRRFTEEPRVDEPVELEEG